MARPTKARKRKRAALTRITSIEFRERQQARRDILAVRSALSEVRRIRGVFQNRFRAIEEELRLMQVHVGDLNSIEGGLAGFLNSIEGAGVLTENGEQQ